MSCAVFAASPGLVSSGPPSLRSTFCMLIACFVPGSRLSTSKTGPAAIDPRVTVEQAHPQDRGFFATADWAWGWLS